MKESNTAIIDAKLMEEYAKEIKEVSIEVCKFAEELRVFFTEERIYDINYVGLHLSDEMSHIDRMNDLMREKANAMSEGTISARTALYLDFLCKFLTSFTTMLFRIDYDKAMQGDDFHPTLRANESVLRETVDEITRYWCKVFLKQL